MSILGTFSPVSGVPDVLAPLKGKYIPSPFSFSFTKLLSSIPSAHRLPQPHSSQSCVSTSAVELWWGLHCGPRSASLWLHQGLKKRSCVRRQPLCSLPVSAVCLGTLCAPTVCRQWPVSPESEIVEWPTCALIFYSSTGRVWNGISLQANNSFFLNLYSPPTRPPQ